MSKFTYTLPSGATYTVVGPADATKAQADYVFYNQVAAGALIGYQSGQTLAGSSVNTHTFSMSRLERGTAGVQNQPLLAVNTRADILMGVLGSVGGDPSGRLPSTIRSLLGNDLGAGVTPPLTDATIESMLQHLPIVAGMPSLATVPTQQPVTQADVMAARGSGLGPTAVGILSPFQVQALQAQTSNIVDQAPEKISPDRGIGKYGFTCYQLEKAGYVKPTTAERFIDPNPGAFESVMRSPTVWLGRDGVDSLDQILNDEDLQNKIQNTLMQAGLAGLNASGVISQTPQTAVTPTTGWVYRSGGLSSTGLQPTSTNTAIGGQKTAVGDLITETATDYSTLTSGVTSVTHANSLNLTNYYYNQVQSALTSKVSGDVGALVVNASKFGPEVTSVWATAGGTDNFTRMMLLGQSTVTNTTAGLNALALNPTGSISAANPLTSAVSNFSNFGATGLSGIPSEVTNQLTNTVNQLSSSLDVLGKASQFSMNFSDIGKNFDDLTSLSKLSDLANTGLNNISNLASSRLNELKGMADGAMNSLSAGLDKLSNLDLGSLTDVGKLSGLIDKAGGLSGLLSKGADLTKLFGGNNALVSGIKVAAGYSNTINRDTVDAAVNKIIGSGKIPTPTFGFPDPTGITSDISAAKDALKGLGDQAVSTLSAGSDTAALTAKYNSSVPVFSQSQINRPLS